MSVGCAAASAGMEQTAMKAAAAAIATRHAPRGASGPIDPPTVTTVVPRPQRESRWLTYEPESMAHGEGRPSAVEMERRRRDVVAVLTRADAGLLSSRPGLVAGKYARM